MSLVQIYIHPACLTITRAFSHSAPALRAVFGLHNNAGKRVLHSGHQCSHTIRTCPEAVLSVNLLPPATSESTQRDALAPHTAAFSSGALLITCDHCHQAVPGTCRLRELPNPRAVEPLNAMSGPSNTVRPT
jgi:epoxyqueuosine reductase QueG